MLDEVEPENSTGKLLCMASKSLLLTNVSLWSKNGESAKDSKEENIYISCHKGTK